MRMKKIFILLFVSVALFSCTRMAEPARNEAQDSTPAVIKTFEVSSESMEEGKASVSPSSGVVCWEEGDAILVSNGAAQAIYTYDENDGLFHNEEGW